MAKLRAGHTLPVWLREHRESKGLVGWVLWPELVPQSKVEDFPVLRDLPVVLAQLLVIVTGVACPSYLRMIFKEYEIHSRDRPM